jgi:hypothetical protein
MRDAFVTAITKAALPPCVVAALDEPPRTQQAPRFPVSLERLTLGLTGSGGTAEGGSGMLTLVAAAMFLAGTLGPTLLEVLEALQNADHVFTTRAVLARLVQQSWVPTPVICRNAQSTLEAIVASLPRSESIASRMQ